jgi:hypothetical protein
MELSEAKRTIEQAEQKARKNLQVKAQRDLGGKYETEQSECLES